ncbi:MAG: HIT family protein [Gemmataceae bacterium]|nr:HIT family protein [Gemmataceae bacterium]
MSASGRVDCPFCHLPAERILAANEHAVALLDAYPVSPGHTLIVSRRHVASYFDLTAEEARGLHELLCQMHARLQAAGSAEGYNVGINVGKAAGQTILHVHLHLIPRYPGDVEDPVGGVRNVIPGRGRYPTLGSRRE